MEEKKTSRAIIIIDDKLVSIKRTKYLETGEYVYYTFPGGHVEAGESFEMTVIREVKEELGIDVKIDELFASIYNEDLKQPEKFYICSYVSGTIGTGDGPEFTNVDLKKYGKYEIVYIDKKDINKYNLLPENIKTALYEKFN